jgi:hypothetical protein
VIGRRRGPPPDPEPRRADTVFWHGLEIAAPRGRGLTVPELARFLREAEAHAWAAGTATLGLVPEITPGPRASIARIWVRIGPRSED